jgi:hypothetical protein
MHAFAVECYMMRVLLLVSSVCILSASAGAETPDLLARAVAKWEQGHSALAFTQQVTTMDDKDKPKDVTVARYDPSQPDDSRWRLLEHNGRAPDDKERAAWESRKNNRKRKHSSKSPSEYLALSEARVIEETSGKLRYEVGLRPEAARLVAVEKLAVLITDKEHADILHVSAVLREPMRIALGIAKVTDLELDLHVETDEARTTPGELKQGGTATVVLSKFGDPVEYKLSDFKRVTPYKPTASHPAVSDHETVLVASLSDS